MENLGLNATADVSSEQAAIWRLIGSNGSHCELSFTKIGAGFGFLGDIQIVKFAKDGLKIVAKRCEIPGVSAYYICKPYCNNAKCDIRWTA